MSKIMLPRVSTLARILRTDATPAHRVALSVAYEQCRYWCAVGAHHNCAGRLEHARRALAMMLGGLNAAEYAGRVAERATRVVWDDDRDCCCPDDRGKFNLADGICLGVMDVCAAAGLAAASVTGLVEPEDERGAVIAEWYRDIVRREWRGKRVLDPRWQRDGEHVRADITHEVIGDGRSLIAVMIEEEAKWPDAGEFRRSLDKILGDALRGVAV